MTDWARVTQGASLDCLIQMYGSSTFPTEAIYAAGAELARRSDPDPTPNLTKWRAEIAAGVRDEYTFDDLWRAACRDMDSGSGSIQ